MLLTKTQAMNELEKKIQDFTQYADELELKVDALDKELGEHKEP